MTKTSAVPRIQVGRTRWDEMALFELVMEPHHKLLDCKWPHLEWLRRETGKNLHIYHHLEVGTFVLCHVIAGPEIDGGPLICTELETLERSPTHPWPYPLGPAAMLARLQPAKALMALYRQQDEKKKAHEKSLKEADRADIADKIKHLRKTGQEKVADGLEHTGQDLAGAQTYRDEVSEIQETLVDLGKAAQK